MKIRVTPQAGQDLQSISDYVTARSPAAARRVRAAILASFDVIAEHPLAGRTVEGGFRKHGVPRYPYLIYYLVDARLNEIRVLSVWHAARSTFRP